VTKSGTNQWHGSLSDYLWNTATSANSFFNIRAGVPRTDLHRNQFGVTVGGPIKKDKAFFFIDYNGRRDTQTDSVERTVPLDSSVEPIGNLRNGGIAYINSSVGCDENSRINTLRRSRAAFTIGFSVPRVLACEPRTPRSRMRQSKHPSERQQ